MRIEEMQVRMDAAANDNSADDEPPWELPPDEAYAEDEAAHSPAPAAIVTETSTAFAPIEWTKLQGEPPPRMWWIPDWLGPWPMLLAGAGGAGKTRLMQMMMTGLATGNAYLEATAKPLRVLMWLCEETQDEVWRQQVAINSHFKIDMSDLELLNIVPRQGLDNTLMDISFGKPTFTPLLEDLRQQVNDVKADILVLDNLAQLFGGNENDRHQTTFFVNRVSSVVQGRPFSPVLLGHVSRSQGSEYSGSAAWENAVRMRWYLGPTLPDQKSQGDEPAETDVMYLARRKANYATKDWRRLRFVNGLLLPDQPPEGRRFDQMFRDESAERVVLSALPKLQAIGLQPTDGKTSGDYLPKQAIDKGFAPGYSKQDLTAAMNRLMGAGRLERRKVGQYSNRMPKFGLVAT